MIFSLNLKLILEILANYLINQLKLTDVNNFQMFFKWEYLLIILWLILKTLPFTITLSLSLINKSSKIIILKIN